MSDLLRAVVNKDSNIVEASEGCFVALSMLRRRSVTALLWLGLFHLALTSAFVSSPNTNISRRSFSPQLQIGSTQPPIPENGIASKGRSDIQAELRSRTVKELKEILKNSHLNKRGILSRLKKKQDLIDYLSIHLSKPDDTSRASILGKSSPKQSSSTKTQSAKAPLQMPSKSMSVSPKEALFQKVSDRYPLAKEQDNLMEVGENDIRQSHHPIFEGCSASDLDLIFVGTASCTPGVTRGVSCTALRLNWKRRSLFGLPPGAMDSEESSFLGGTWLFDCGECTQLQVQRTPSVKPGKITKIFITHAHGDHSFGLPGLLCLMGQDRDRETAPPVEIYGPEGLRMWLRTAIRYSCSRIVPNYRIHELKDIPMAPEWKFSRRSNRYFYAGLKENNARRKKWRFQGLAGEDNTNWISNAAMMGLQASRLYGEIDGGRDIFPVYDHPKSSDGAPVWEVENEGDVKVFAAPMSHGIPCVGYVVEEQTKPGRLRNEYVKPIVERNLQALKDSGFKVPMKAMAVIKNLPVGSHFSFPDGTVITQEDAVEPPRKGRKVVICGDTASSRAITGLAMDADIVIHEATNSFLQGLDKSSDLRAVTRDTIVHGHSTPHMAGRFAKSVRAKRLVLNHFSARYRGDPSIDSISIMTRLEEQAVKASGLSTASVAAAWDFMVLPVPQNADL